MRSINCAHCHMVDAAAFLRNDKTWHPEHDPDGKGGNDGYGWTYLLPVCRAHIGECLTTVVSLEEGIGQYLSQTVLEG